MSQRRTPWLPSERHVKPALRGSRLVSAGHQPYDDVAFVTDEHHSRHQIFILPRTMYWSCFTTPSSARRQQDMERFTRLPGLGSLSESTAPASIVASKNRVTDPDKLA